MYVLTLQIAHRSISTNGSAQSSNCWPICAPMSGFPISAKNSSATPGCRSKLLTTRDSHGFWSARHRIPLKAITNVATVKSLNSTAMLCLCNPCDMMVMTQDYYGYLHHYHHQVKYLLFTEKTSIRRKCVRYCCKTNTIVFFILRVTKRAKFHLIRPILVEFTDLCIIFI